MSRLTTSEQHRAHKSVKRGTWVPGAGTGANLPATKISPQTVGRAQRVAPAKPLTHQQLRRLSPTLNALHNLTSHDVIHSAAQSDAALAHAFRHLSPVPGVTTPATFQDEKKLRQDVRQELGQKQKVTLASGRQIQTTGAIAKALGGQGTVTQPPEAASSNAEDRTRQHRRVLAEPPEKARQVPS